MFSKAAQPEIDPYSVSKYSWYQTHIVCSGVCVWVCVRCSGIVKQQLHQWMKWAHSGVNGWVFQSILKARGHDICLLVLLYGESWDKQHAGEPSPPVLHTMLKSKIHSNAATPLFPDGHSSNIGHQIQYFERLQITFTFEEEITFIDLH